MTKKTTYAECIREGFDFLLGLYPEVFVIGQGLWSPWYVGNTMKDLDKKYGKERIVDTPVSECGVTGAGVGAAIAGMRPIVVHPRMDFMLYAMDPIVNQAAKWNFIYGGQQSVPLTIRAIINRGGEQGAQHSQALHSWFSHIPGLRVVMPYTATDARDLLIASVLCNDPVIFIDDRWLYEKEGTVEPPSKLKLNEIKPQYLRHGSDLTIVSSGYSSELVNKAEESITKAGLSYDHIDMRVLSPTDWSGIYKSVQSTGRLLVVDGGWSTCGYSSEIIARCAENVPLGYFKSSPQRITLAESPAPTSQSEEDAYYPQPANVTSRVLDMIKC